MKTETKLTPQQEFAKILDGWQIGEEISDEGHEIAGEKGLIVVFVASDDLCEIRGRLLQEFYVYEGCKLLWDGSNNRFIEVRNHNEYYDEFDEEVDFDTEKDGVKRPVFWIFQEWRPKDYEGSWRFTTNIPNAAEFKVFEGDEICGNGLVIHVDDLKNATDDKGEEK